MTASHTKCRECKKYTCECPPVTGPTKFKILSLPTCTACHSTKPWKNTALWSEYQNIASELGDEMFNHVPYSMEHCPYAN